MPMNASFGVFPSQSAVRSKSSPDLNRLYFRTSQRYEFDWRTLPEQDRPENFDAVHNIGKRTTKYMKFQKKEAPLVDRTACRYTMEFGPKPLGDSAANKELAETFKGAAKLNASPSFGVNSNYKETYVHPTDKQLKGARQKSCAPKALRTKTLGGTDDFMEPLSSMHKSYPTHPMEMARAQPAIVPKPNLTMSGASVGELYRSQSQRDYEGRKPSGGGQTKWEDYMPEQPPYVLADDSIYRVRRSCFLSPGN